MTIRSILGYILGLGLLLASMGSYGQGGSAFSGTFDTFAFTHDTPSSGSFTCGIKATGGDMGTLRAATGTFTAIPVDGVTAQVTTMCTGSTSKYDFTFKGTLVTDIGTGTIGSSYLECTKVDRKTKVATKTITASGAGSFTGVNYNTTTGSITGTF